MSIDPTTPCVDLTTDPTDTVLAALYNSGVCGQVTHNELEEHTITTFTTNYDVLFAMIGIPLIMVLTILWIGYAYRKGVI